MHAWTLLTHLCRQTQAWLSKFLPSLSGFQQQLGVSPPTCVPLFDAVYSRREDQLSPPRRTGSVQRKWGITRWLAVGTENHFFRMPWSIFRKAVKRWSSTSGQSPANFHGGGTRSQSLSTPSFAPTSHRVASSPRSHFSKQNSFSRSRARTDLFAVNASH